MCNKPETPCQANKQEGSGGSLTGVVSTNKHPWATHGET